MLKTFREYLADKHAEQYVGTDDMMPDDFNDWMSDLDVEDVVDLAEKWGGPKFPDNVTEDEKSKYFGRHFDVREESKGQDDPLAPFC